MEDILSILVIAGFFGDLFGTGSRMGPFECRIRGDRLGEGSDGLMVKVIEARGGPFPVFAEQQIGWITSVIDNTDQEPAPIISMVGSCQEPHTTFFGHFEDGGVVRPDQGFTDWVPVGVIPTEFLLPPVGGRRKITAVVRLVDMRAIPDITGGFGGRDMGLLWMETFDFWHEFDEKGYKEVAEDRKEAQALSVKIAVGVAMADGTLDDSEGETIKRWITKSIEGYSDEERERLKNLYNDAFKDAYAKAKTGKIILNELYDRLHEIGGRKEKADAIGLCFDVMTADSVIDAGETAVINMIAAGLGIDPSLLEAIRDGAIAGKKLEISGESGVEDLVGIDSDWSDEEVSKHLQVEFTKWNGRLNTMPEGPDRDHAQSMLDNIAEARRNNQPCPCGSGKKFKECCGGGNGAAGTPAA